MALVSEVLGGAQSALDSNEALKGLSVNQFRRDSGAPAVGYCLVFLPVDFGPRGTLGLQLSGIAWSFLFVTLRP